MKPHVGVVEINTRDQPLVLHRDSHGKTAGLAAPSWSIREARFRDEANTVEISTREAETTAFF